MAYRPLTPPDPSPIWDRCSIPPLNLPILEHDATADAVVIGLGGSGLAAVHELLDAGLDVIGIDATTVAGAAAGRNGGFFLAGLADFHHDAVARHGEATATTIFEMTLAEMDHIESLVPEAIERCGSLRIASTDSELADCTAQLTAMRLSNLPVESYSGTEGTGLLFPADGTIQPMLRARRLATLALDRGARLYEFSPATHLTTGSVTTPRACLTTQHILACIDGNLELLFPELNHRVNSTRLQMLATAPLNSHRISRPVYSRFGKDYWRTTNDGRIALGGGRDIGGLAEWTNEPLPSPVVQHYLDNLLHSLYPTAEITHRWAGIVAFTQTGLPLVEELRPRIWVAGGYCGTGNVIGAIAGRNLALLAQGTSAPFAELVSAATATVNT